VQKSTAFSAFTAELPKLCAKLRLQRDELTFKDFTLLIYIGCVTARDSREDRDEKSTAV